jgi:hypothetical protein
MKEKIQKAIDNSLHYLHGNEVYVTDLSTYVSCVNREFLEAIKVQIYGEIEIHPDLGPILNFL